MERDAEEPDNNEPSNLWSGSDASQEHCVAESFADSYYEDDASDAEYRLDPLPVHVESEVKSPELYQNEEWKPTGEQQQPPGFNGSEEEVSYQGEDEEDFFLSDSRESLPHVQTSPPVSPRLQRPDSEPKAGKMSLTRSSSLSTDGAADATLALTPTRGQPQKASNRRCPGTLNMGVDSSEEGGSHEAPPASVFFGMPDEGAEPAETWNSESDTDLCRPDTQGLRNTRTGHNESQSERQAKENKSKCKKIARLLTNAPNPHNKGALLFNKRRQRVEKYTLVSYGTGDHRHGGQEQLEEELEESGSAGYDFVETTDSEIEEEYCVHHQQQNFSPNWRSLRDMEALPDTSGKGVLMFAKCRKRVDEIASEQEQLRNKGMEKLFGPACTEAQNIYDAQQLYYPADDVDVNIGQQGAYQDVFQQINHPSSNMSRGLVSNRTAKPFPGFQDSGPAPFISGGAGPPTKKHERKFKVPVLTNTNPQVWSPTGDIIASRDERISVPAIKTGILPESKRRAGSKQASLLGQDKQNKGDGRSCVDAEEDCFSLGAEACNFMQPRRIKLRNPPPVAPKPAMNPACPPVMRRSPLSEPYIPQRSPVSQPCQTYARPHSQQHLQQRDWDPSRNSHSGPGGAQAMPHTPAKTHIPQPLLPPARKNRSQQPPQSTGFGRSLSLSLPRQQNAIPFGTPEGRPGIHSSNFSRQRSLQEKVYKPLSPWEAASRSPLGSVDEAFELQGQPSSVASSVVLAGQHRSLPEPPDEWKRRVSLEPAAMGVGRYPPAPPFQAPSLSQTFSPEKPSFYGPPLRPAQPLNLKGKPSVAYVRQSSSPSKYSPLYGAIH